MILSPSQVLGVALLLISAYYGIPYLRREWRCYQIRREMQELQRGRDLRKLFTEKR